MTVEIYRLLHLAGVLMVFLAFGGLIGRSLLGVDGVKLKKLAGITSGVGLILVLLGGFGLLAKLSYGFPGWAMVKLAVWIALGGLIAVANRKPNLAKCLWWGILILGLIAASMVVWKPF